MSRILLVEDDPMLRDALCAMLRRRGYRVIEVASSGNEAIRTLAGGPFDLIISDYYMPDGSGRVVLDHVRRDGATHPPFILITGQTDVSAEELYGAGIQEFVVKPISPRELAEIIARYVPPA